MQHIHLVCSPNAAQGWQAALRVSPRGYRITSTTSSLSEAQAGIKAEIPDFLIVEARSTDDFRVLQLLAQDLPELDCIIVGIQPDADTLLGLMRAGVREVLPAHPDDTTLSQAVERLARKRGGTHRAARKAKILCFISCKGGSGATFLAANLAVALAADGARKVALLDFNLQFGDALLFISSQQAHSHVAEVAMNSERLDQEFLKASMLEVSPGLRVLPAPEDPALAEEVHASHVRAIVQTAQSEFDYIVIDLGRTLNAVALQALDMADQVYAVLQLTLPFIRDGKRLQQIFTSLDYPPGKISWIVNRFEKGGQLTLADVKKTLKIEDLFTIPNHYGVVADSVNQGVPVSKIAPHSPVTLSIAELASTINQVESPTASPAGLRSILGKLVGKRTGGVSA
ncbi:MAG: AAA family ATPase [Aquabacterium sp.]|uniref:AAA family ATPase n=1 Tax=Aquabacterium sp. TaxID=1872578 RepID=UPI0025BEAC2C|nr:AAA family ATPase [Aquabacterium sp.]MBI3381534.1 AAA family ATPase [Aquabacterium sp.]